MRSTRAWCEINAGLVKDQRGFDVRSMRERVAVNEQMLYDSLDLSPRSTRAEWSGHRNN
ncbi:MAG: hypothetical protein ACRC8A_15800 [Microcoleaceae cyanobacterium]